MSHALLPFYGGIGILSCFTGYQIYLSRTYQGNYRDKLYFYHSHLITVIPIILYMYTIFQVSIGGKTPALDIFYIEWTFTTPLLIMNLGRILNIPLTSYIFLTLADIAMILCGYISYLAKVPELVYTTFGLGCLFYCFLMGFFLKALKTCKRRQIAKQMLQPTSIYRDSLRYRIFRSLLLFLVISWNVYPCIHILYKEGYLTPDDCCIAYVILDILEKGIFTNLLLGSRELYAQSSPSLVGRITKSILRVHPLEPRVSHHCLEELAVSGTGIVVHPTNWTPTLDSIQEDSHVTFHTRSIPES